MPNHVTNRLTILGSDKEVEDVLKFIQIDCSSDTLECCGIGTIDFNKITPMPKWVFQENLGLEDEKKYGAENCWYSWSVQNWGTKWNAYDQLHRNEVRNEIYFDTAWCSPVDLIKKLSWIFPDTSLKFEWAEEGCGDIGAIIFKDGIITDQLLPTNFDIETLYRDLQGSSYFNDEDDDDESSNVLYFPYTRTTNGFIKLEHKII
jgi:hypothetical protein